MKRIFVAAVFFSVLISVYSQDATWFFDSFAASIQNEAQKYLMFHEYSVSTTEPDDLRVNKIIHDKDDVKGTMLTITAFKFNGDRGVVITTFDHSLKSIGTQNIDGWPGTFKNIVLNESEFIELYSLATGLRDLVRDNNYIHRTKRFNERMVLDAYTSSNPEATWVNIWIDEWTRHAMSYTKWKRAYRKYFEFFGEKTPK